VALQNYDEVIEFLTRFLEIFFLISLWTYNEVTGLLLVLEESSLASNLDKGLKVNLFFSATAAKASAFSS
jgi:hypothetical protein